MIRKNKQYFIYYLKDNIFIFDVFDYIEELAADYVDHCFEWNLTKDNFVIEKSTHIKEYIQLYVTDALIVINDKLSKHNCKILCYFYKKEEFNDWKSFYKDPEKFIKIAKTILKRRLNNFIETEEKGLFKNIKGTFNELPCLIPSGEDLEFISHNKKKLK
jgi:hypothetical protein